MGNGSTKLNSTEGETIPIKTQSTPIARFEEFRKRRNVESTLSKKNLLKNAEQENRDSNVTQSSSHENNETKDHKVSITTTKEEATGPLITTEKISRVVPLENSEYETTKEKVNINIDIDLSEDKVIHANEKVKAEIKTDDEIVEEIVENIKKRNELHKLCEKIDENDNDKETEEFGRYLCPGSPSFRIYCTADERKAEEEEKEQEHESPIIVMHQKSRSADSVESVATMNTGVTNDVREIVEDEPNTKRKGNKMKKFGAVRTLLKVKSLYNPMCTCTGDDRNRVIAAKAAAN